MKPHRQIISRIPQRGMDADQWSRVIQTELVTMWVESMSAEDMMQYAGACVEGHLMKDRVPRDLYVKLDEIILHQTETIGWRITLSELVRFRFSSWDHDSEGPEMFKKLGAAMRRSALILQGRELPPVEDSDLWAVKNETVHELRLVLQTLRSNLASRREEPSGEEVRKIFSDIVTGASQSFPHVFSNLERWSRFLEEARPLRPMLMGDRRLTPASLYYQFLSWSSGWEPESLRQAITELKPKL